MNITLKQLRVFTEVAQCGSMNRAAAVLHLTPPAVSMQIKQMETALGLVLFNRDKKRLTLSTAGDYFAGYARRVLADLRDAEIAVARLKRLESGLLTIGIASMAEYFVPEMLARFHDGHPSLDVKLRVVHSRDQMISLLDAAEIDLCVMGRPPRELGVSAHAFVNNPLVFVCAPHHAVLNRGPVSVKAIAETAIIVREPGTSTRMSMEAFFTKHRCSPNISMEITSSQAIKQAVIAGMGLGFVPLHSIVLELRNGLLSVIRVAGTPVMATWNIVNLHSRMLSPAAEAFRDFIMKQGARELRANNSRLLALAFGRSRARMT
jgi:DNA-binding transcriptional LysR family regulator